jgi:hypothetical protein
VLVVLTWSATVNQRTKKERLKLFLVQWRLALHRDAHAHPEKYKEQCPEGKYTLESFDAITRLWEQKATDIRANSNLEKYFCGSMKSAARAMLLKPSIKDISSWINSGDDE